MYLPYGVYCCILSGFLLCCFFYIDEGKFCDYFKILTVLGYKSDFNFLSFVFLFTTIAIDTNYFYVGNSSFLRRPLKQYFCFVYWPNFGGRTYTWLYFHSSVILSMLCNSSDNFPLFFISAGWKVIVPIDYWHWNNIQEGLAYRIRQRLGLEFSAVNLTVRGTRCLRTIFSHQIARVLCL